MAALLTGCSSLSHFEENPVTVACADYDAVWDGTIEVLEKYFDVEYENRYDGRIETKPDSASTLFEPWRHDSIDCSERLLATLQTIRRRAFVLVQPGPAGGFDIHVEVYKELEDLKAPMNSTFGGGTFISSIEPIREELVTSSVSAPDGWISLGRDTKLEAAILVELRERIDSCCPQ